MELQKLKKAAQIQFGIGHPDIIFDTAFYNLYHKNARICIVKYLRDLGLNSRQIAELIDKTHEWVKTTLKETISFETHPILMETYNDFLSKIN